MDLHYDTTTGKANEVTEKDLANAYRQAIEKIVEHLSLELFKYNRTSKEIPNDIFRETHIFIDKVRADFIDNILTYYFNHNYICATDYRNIFASFYETIAQLEDVYLYRTIYRKSSFHYGYENYKKMINKIRTIKNK